MSHLNC